MDEKKVLADRFEANRNHLKAVAYRMLGSAAEAEDAVQEAWLRLARTDASAVDNLGGWLTTVVARVCLDMLRSRQSRREQPMGPDVPEPVAGSADEPDHDALMADSVGLALLVVLEKLAPAERVAFVLHDMFNLPFDQIAPIVGRSPDATRQLASRARRRVQGTGEIAQPDRDRKKRSSKHFSPPHATATSKDCSRCSIPTSHSAPMRRQRRWAASAKSAAPRRSPICSRAARRQHGRRWSMAKFLSRSSLAGNSASCWRSRC
jgi:RNA polymerase sigma factor (sigma-70 family)